MGSAIADVWSIDARVLRSSGRTRRSFKSRVPGLMESSGQSVDKLGLWKAVIRCFEELECGVEVDSRVWYLGFETFGEQRAPARLDLRHLPGSGVKLPQ